jgi:hypothetical protein
MLSIAGINRLRLTPHLVQIANTAGSADALRQLRNNSLVEATVGAIILVIVGVLGTLEPGLHDEAAWPHPIHWNTADPPRRDDARTRSRTSMLAVSSGANRIEFGK